MQRFRIEYSKKEALRYTGNLDMQKVWERYLRRSSLVVAYSQGFHPQAKIQQACPLPLGYLSNAEIVDIWLDDDQIDPQGLFRALTTAPQPGIEIKAITAMPLNDPALQSRVVAASYNVEFLDDQSLCDLPSGIQRVLTAKSLIRQRRMKNYDLRPLIEELVLDIGGLSQLPVLAMRLSAREGATGRPEEVLLELGQDPARARITRTALIFKP